MDASEIVVVVGAVVGGIVTVVSAVTAAVVSIRTSRGQKEIHEGQKEIHELVNSQMEKAKELIANLRKEISLLTGKAADEKLADDARVDATKSKPTREAPQ